MYVFSHEFIGNLAEMTRGPGKLRFILQPLVAVLLGVLDGLRDARTGAPPFLFYLIFHREKRRELWKSAKARLLLPFIVAIAADSFFQLVIFGTWHPGGALVVGVLLVGLPYSVIRGVVNRGARLQK